MSVSLSFSYVFKFSHGLDSYKPWPTVCSPLNGVRINMNNYNIYKEFFLLSSLSALELQGSIV